MLQPFGGLLFFSRKKEGKHTSRFRVVQCVCSRLVPMRKSELRDNLPAGVSKPPLPHNASRWEDVPRLVSGLINDELCWAQVGLLTYHVVCKPTDMLMVIGQLNIRKSFLRQRVLTVTEAATRFRNFNFGSIAVHDMKSTFGFDMKADDTSVLRRRMV